jgi:hypothetical protein
MRIALKLSIALAAASFALAASAQTVYKLIDKNGRITYSEEPPKNFDGQVIRIDIDPNANTATLPKPPTETQLKERTRAREEKEKAAAEKKQGNVDDLKQRLEDARKVLKDAQDHPGDDDVQYFGTKGGGVRVVPTEAYQAKIAKLTDDVKRAEDALRNAGGTP